MLFPRLFETLVDKRADALAVIDPATGEHLTYRELGCRANRLAHRLSQRGVGPEVRVGLPSVIEAALLPMLIGWGKTRELLLTGANYAADEAFAMGFVEKLVPAERRNASVDDWLDQILQSGAVAVRSQKALISRWERLGIDAAIEAGIEHFAAAYESDEPARMIAPFFGQRD